MGRADAPRRNKVHMYTVDITTLQLFLGLLASHKTLFHVSTLNF